MTAAIETIHVTIDGRGVAVPAGSSVLDAINRAGIVVPQLCKDPDRPAIGACRTCLVQVEGLRGMPASCSTPARDGMAVQTSTPELIRVRRGVLELTLGMQRDPAAGNGANRQLREAAARHGIADLPFEPLVRPGLDQSNPFFQIDMGQCILCARCVVGCDEVQHIGAISLINNGYTTKIGTFADAPLRESICTSCGQCLAACPTGAIALQAVDQPVVKEVETTCPYCGVGCGIKVRVGPNESLLSVDDAPANRSSEGMLCVKGRFGFPYVNSGERVTTPLIKRDGQWYTASWDEALELVAGQFAQHRGHFAAFASAKATNEDDYLMQKFVRGVMGSNNIDHCTRLCHSPSVEAMIESMGSGATSNSYTDYESAGCLLVVGADATSNHPVIAVRFRKAVDEHGAKLIVINPKRIDLCAYADLWLRNKPGTDVALLNGLAKVIRDEGLADEPFIRERTEGYEEWQAGLDQYTPEWVSEVTGVPAADIVQAARWYARPPFSGSCLIWGMGITQHTNGTANAFALLNLALVSGQLGRPGSGISPLRGQNNVQGCGDAGCIPDSLPGYQGYRPEALAKFEQAWACPLPSEKGLTVNEIVDSIPDGTIRAMYIMGENPMISEPNLKHCEQNLRQLDFLVVQDLFLHETAELADVFLPGTSFAEKDGTFTNSERRVQRVRQAIAPVGQSRPDWQILCDLAQRVARKTGADPGQFEFEHPGAIFDEMAQLTPILSGISYGRLEQGGIQWPCPTPDHPGTPYLYAESFPRGKGRFTPVQQGPRAAELPDAEYPFLLNTGRVLYHWHGGTMTKRVKGLVDLVDDVEIQIHPSDAARLGVADGERVRVSSRRNTLTARARLSDAVHTGETFMPFVRFGESTANMLTNTAYDPASKIPEYKVSAVRIERLS